MRVIAVFTALCVALAAAAPEKTLESLAMRQLCVSNRPMPIA